MDSLETLLQHVTVNAHSSVRIAASGKVIYVDPFALQTAPHDADLIFLTHDHFDHLSPEDIARVRKPDTLFILPHNAAASAAAAAEGCRILTVGPGEQAAADGLAFETVPAYNPGKPFHPRQKGWVGYVLTVEGLRVYIAGDTDATEEAAAVRCDVALLPIGGKYTMNPEEAAALAERIRPAVVLPIHYGSVTGSPEDYDRFCAALDPTIRVRRAF